jgi:serine protease
MRKLLICGAVVAAATAAPLLLQMPSAQTVAAPATTARVIVKFRAESTLLRKQALSAAGQRILQASALGERIGIQLDPGRSISDRSHVVFGRGMSSKQLAARIATESDVEYAVADERKRIVEVPNDPLYATGPAVTPTNGGPLVGQWYLRQPGVATGAAGSTAPAAINAEQAWDVWNLAKSSTSIVVAVLDTGLRFDHPDLQGGNVLPGYDMISDDATSADGQPGRDSDASDPGDYVTQADVDNPATGCSQSDISNSSWHGTQTLGLIGAATGNGVGMASVSHGGVKVMPVRVLGKCGGFDSDITAGMRWAAGLSTGDPTVPANLNPARVLNMSLGGQGPCLSATPGQPNPGQAYIDAIAAVNAAGATVVVAGGNGGSSTVSVPASCPGAIGVAGLRHAGDMVGYSDAGPEISIAAPAGNCVNTSGLCQYPILTTSNKGPTAPIPAANGGATYTDGAEADASIGTSFSAPLVSGTVALMLSVQPALTPAQVKAKLRATARPFLTTGGVADAPVCPARSPTSSGCYCTTSTCGAGMLDAHAAVLAAASVQAGISLTTTTPTANQAVNLTSTSIAGPGRTIATYQWSILNAGTTGATITGASDSSSVVVTPTAPGAFLVQLMVTDDLGASSTTTLSVTVVSDTLTSPASTPAPTSSGGGGAIDATWLALLLAAVALLAATAPRRGSRRRAVSATSSRTD